MDCDILAAQLFDEIPAQRVDGGTYPSCSCGAAGKGNLTFELRVEKVLSALRCFLNRYVVGVEAEADISLPVSPVKYSALALAQDFILKKTKFGRVVFLKQLSFVQTADVGLGALDYINEETAC
jgi:hypothetical protein